MGASKPELNQEQVEVGCHALGPDMKKRAAPGDGNGMEQRLWELALDSAQEEVARALYHLTPDVPLTPELRLHWAIFGQRRLDYRARLVETFVLLNRPKGEWEDYKESCIAWVSGMLADAVAQETDLVKDAVRQLLLTLPERLRAVLWVRFGFDGQGPRTLEQVGKEFRVTRERVRQLEAKALRMLRHPSRSIHLRHVLPGERFRARAFNELERNPSAPAVFLMWREDREALLSQTVKRAEEDGQAGRQELDRLKCLVRDAYQAPITEVGLSRRAVTALLRCGRWAPEVPTLGEVAVLSDRELLSLSGFGEKALKEVMDAIRRAANGRTNERSW